jgi:uncharacterized protein
VGRTALTRWISYFAFGWMGAFSLFLGGSLLTDVVFLGARGLDSPWGADRVLQARALLAICVPAFLYGLYIAPRPKIRRVRVELDGLPPALSGFKIAQLTDVHIGELLRAPFLRRVVTQVNSLHADAVAITGDLIDGKVSDVAPDLQALSELKSKFGTYYVTGNHEYYHGAAEWTAAIRALGIHLLENEHRVLQSGDAQLAIGGVPDLEASRFFGRGPSPAQAFAGLSPTVPRVLLAHQPRMASLIGEERVDLQLSGHTHGGQLWPFVPLVRLQQPVISGLRKLGSTWVYTSNGTGYWGPPVRLGPRGEITLITLVSPPGRRSGKGPWSDLRSLFVSGKKSHPPPDEPEDSLLEEDWDQEFEDLDGPTSEPSAPRKPVGKKWNKLNAAFAGDDEFSLSSVAPDKRKKPPAVIVPEPKGKPEANKDQKGVLVRLMRKIFVRWRRAPKTEMAAGVSPAAIPYDEEIPT